MVRALLVCFLSSHASRGSFFIGVPVAPNSKIIFESRRQETNEIFSYCNEPRTTIIINARYEESLFCEYGADCKSLHFVVVLR